MSGKSFLHIGCGPKFKNQTTRGFNTEDWLEIRFDIDPAVRPDILGTMTDMSAVATASVDAIFSSHNIEHLYPHEVPVALREFHRVLKPGGYIVVTCPDLQSVCALIAEGRLLEPAYTSPAGPISPIDILYGHRASMAQGNLFMAHRCGFTSKALMDTVRAFGFKCAVSRRREHPAYDLWIAATVDDRTDADMHELAALHFPGGSPQPKTPATASTDK